VHELWKRSLLSDKGEAVSCGHLITSENATHFVAPLRDRRWYAIYTRSLHEKSVAEHFAVREIEHFYPSYRVVRRWKNRCTKTLDLPLFPGYVFVNIALSERLSVLNVPSVASIVSAGNTALPLKDSQIELLRAGLTYRNAEPHAYLNIGQRVRICQGPLEGMQGFVIRTDHKLRVVLSLDVIMKSVSVEVDEGDVEPIDPTSPLPMQ
jgi:transcription antitermination factor NusG